MSNYKLGFLLSVYKRDNPKYLNECLESIQNQTKSAFETIVVVEGKIADDVKAVLLNYTKTISGFKIYYLEEQRGPLNYGLPSCLNYGISKSESDYIMRIDSDDINFLNRVEETSKFVENYQNVKLFGSNVVEYDEKMLVEQKQRRVPKNHKDIIKFSKFRCPFNGPAVTFHKDTAIKLGCYPQVGSNEDYCLWISFLKFGYQSYNLQKNLVKMRADIGLIKRRSSLRYIKGELQAMRYIFGIGYFNFPLYIFHITTKIIIRLLLPNFIISKLYSKFFRV